MAEEVRPGGGVAQIARLLVSSVPIPYTGVVRLLDTGYVARSVRRLARHLALLGLLFLLIGCVSGADVVGKASKRQDVPVVVGLVVGGLCCIGTAVLWTSRPDLHPGVRRLARYGSVTDIVKRIDGEMGEHPAGPLVVTSEWLVASWHFFFEAWRLEDVLWIGDGPGGCWGPHPVCIARVHARTRDRDIRVYRALLDEVKDDVRISAPWVLLNLDVKTARAFSRDRMALVAQVDARREAAPPC